MARDIFRRRWFPRSPRRQSSPSVSIYTVSLSEAATAADTISATVTYVASLTEAASSSDTINATASNEASITESGSAADTISAIATVVVSLSETAHATDNLSAVAIYPVSLSESESATDAIGGSVIYRGSLSEAASADNSLSATAILRPALSEAASATDTIWATDGVLDTVAIETLIVDPDPQGITDSVALESLIVDPDIKGIVDDVLTKSLVLDPDIRGIVDAVVVETLMTTGVAVDAVATETLIATVTHGLFFWNYLYLLEQGFSTVCCWVAGLWCGEHPINSNGSVFVPWQSDPDGLLTPDYLMDLSNNPPEGGFAQSTCNIDLTDQYGITTRVVVDCAIGLCYTSQLQILRPHLFESMSRFPTSSASTRRAHQYGARLTDVQGISVGTTTANLRPVAFLDLRGNKYPVSQLFTGVHWDFLDDDYGYDSMLMIEMTQPFPATINSVIIFMKAFKRDGT